MPQTTPNWLCNNYETGNIGKANHVRFDEGMNNLPANLIPLNQLDLKHVENGTSLLPRLTKLMLIKSSNALFARLQ